VAVGRIGANDHDYVGLHDRIKILCTDRLAGACSSGHSQLASGTRAQVSTLLFPKPARELLDGTSFVQRDDDSADRIAPISWPGCV
jgi:hypothetical protein